VPCISFEVKPSLANLGKIFQGMDLRGALQENIEKFGFTVEAKAKPLTPVDTGLLRASIHTHIGNLSALIADYIEYAPFVHWGTRYMRGRPFLVQGLAEAARQFGDEQLARRLDKEISAKLGKV